MKFRIHHVLLGFFLGVFFIISCGGSSVSSAIADSIGSAINVVFSNTDSGLESTTVQDALDELDGKVDALENSNVIEDDLESLLVGTWSGTYEYTGTNFGDPVEVSITFNSDGTYSCVDDTSKNQGAFRGSYDGCEGNSASWSVYLRTIKLQWVYEDVTQKMFFRINYLSASRIELTQSNNEVVVLTKEL